MPEPARGEQGGGKLALTVDLLGRLADRTAGSDTDTGGLAGDFAELQRSGYLRMAVPEMFGGLGLSLPEVARQQRRLAYRAPAAALAANLHICWTGLAADRYRAGDESLGWLLAEAAAGEVFAAGYGQPGNDLVLAQLATRAEPAAGGGYRCYGPQALSCPPLAWTRLGVHALDSTDPAQLKIVHAFLSRDTLSRDAPGYRVRDHQPEVSSTALAWGSEVLLEGVAAEPERIARVLPASASRDPFLTSSFAWTLSLSASICCAIGQRTLDLVIETAREDARGKPAGQPVSHRQATNWTLTEAALELGAIETQVNRITADWIAGVDYGGKWIPKLFAMKHNAEAAARRILDLAGQTTGRDGS
jgi:alkylation response protein AidB-like acyl-CoA dehydrogenase